MVILIAVSLAFFGYLLYQKQRADKLPEAVVMNDKVEVFSLRPGDIIQSPLTIKGRARGYWFFEASFPVRVQDASGTDLGSDIATAQDEWMTEEFVPFTATVEFSEPAGGFGFVVLQKDNPSGLPEHADEVRVPVRFFK
jgi:hypothetical protein